MGGRWRGAARKRRNQGEGRNSWNKGLETQPKVFVEGL
jgi:hypothetical protein